MYMRLRDEARLIALNLADSARTLLNPTLRIGVTGLSHAGKTVLITALIQALREGGRLPLLEASSQGRIVSAVLDEQPDDSISRFQFEQHLADLTAQIWPQSTRTIAQIRLVITYQSTSNFAFAGTFNTLTLDLVDYPGEWLLDLPLLNQTYAQWSEQALALSRTSPRNQLAGAWHQHLATLKAAQPAHEPDAIGAAKHFTAYLRACRTPPFALSNLPPGRFLLPGDMEGSPALTFAPLDQLSDSAPAGSLHAMMERRYASYCDLVVRPFYFDHFARLDRQIVLVDVLSALNAGPDAMQDLQRALRDILLAFRVGQNSLLSTLFRPRISKILFAATRADHLNHKDHARLEAILQKLTDNAIGRAETTGAQVKIMALAALRATVEAQITHNNEALPAIIGTPMAGERIGDQLCDGETQLALFAGDLPSDPEHAIKSGRDLPSPEEAAIRFVRFRPPVLPQSSQKNAPWPHIRLDSALQFLIGDRLGSDLTK